MCGIWGSVSSTKSIPVPDAWNGLCSLRDRGPDDWGLYTNQAGKLHRKEDLDGRANIILGNRRLRILDLSPAGNQPITVNGRYWLVFNGEIYNYLELREQLQTLGHSFTSDSDTEVLLHAYLEWGDRCVKHLRGMFAFTVWDSQDKELFAARDRLGIKPFYYSKIQGHLAFASELQSLLENSLVDPILNPIGIDGFLAFGSVPGPQTIIEGVKTLPPGCTLHYETDTTEFKINRYWRPDFSGDTSPATSEIRTLIEEAISLQLRSDVPIGAFLSGGLDSSSIVASMQAANNETDVRTFSITFDEEDYAEGDDAAAIAAKLGTDHETHVVTADDVREKVDEIITAMDQPTIDGVNTFFVSKVASDAGLRVALSGVGGDEVFGGYNTFRLIPRMEMLVKGTSKLPDSINKLLASSLDSVDSRTEKPLGKLADLIRGDDPFGSAYTVARGLFTLDQRSHLLDSAQQFDQEISHKADAVASTDKVSEAELANYMQNQLLRDTDVMSMEHSLEVRVPLLDGPLVSAIAAADPSDKAGDKPLLEQAMAGLVPGQARSGQKQGFTFPFAEWLDDELVDVVNYALSPKQLEATPLDQQAVNCIRDQFNEGKIHWSRLWALVVLSLWINEHIKQGGNENE